MHLGVCGMGLHLAYIGYGSVELEGVRLLQVVYKIHQS